MTQQKGLDMFVDRNLNNLLKHIDVNKYKSRQYEYSVGKNLSLYYHENKHETNIEIDYVESYCIHIQISSRP